MNYMNISIDGYSKSYSVPERQDVYNPSTGEYTYLLGGCTAK